MRVLLPPSNLHTCAISPRLLHRLLVWNHATNSAPRFEGLSSGSAPSAAISTAIDLNYLRGGCAASIGSATAPLELALSCTPWLAFNIPVAPGGFRAMSLFPARGLSPTRSGERLCTDSFRLRATQASSVGRRRACPSPRPNCPGKFCFTRQAPLAVHFASFQRQPNIS